MWSARVEDFPPSSVLVTTSKALVTSSDALVPSSVLVKAIHSPILCRWPPLRAWRPSR